MENAKKIGVDEIIIVVGKYRESIERMYGNTYEGIDIVYVVQPKPIGLMNAISYALPHVANDDMFLQLGDELFEDIKILQMKEMFSNSNANFVCGVTYENAEEIKKNYSVCVNDNNDIIDCVEKPQHVKNNIKGTGLCIFSHECVDFLSTLPESQFPKELCDYMLQLIRNGYVGKIFNIAKREFNINTLLDLNTARTILSSR